MNGSPPGAPVRDRTKRSWPNCSAATNEDRVKSGRYGLSTSVHARPGRDARHRRCGHCPRPGTGGMADERLPVRSQAMRYPISGSELRQYADESPGSLPAIISAHEVVAAYWAAAEARDW